MIHILCMDVSLFVFFIFPELSVAITLLIVISPPSEQIAEIIFRVIEICHPTFHTGLAVRIQITDISDRIGDLGHIRFGTYPQLIITYTVYYRQAVVTGFKVRNPLYCCDGVCGGMPFLPFIKKFLLADKILYTDDTASELEYSRIVVNYQALVRV